MRVCHLHEQRALQRGSEEHIASLERQIAETEQRECELESQLAGVHVWSPVHAPVAAGVNEVGGVLVLSVNST